MHARFKVETGPSEEESRLLLTTSHTQCCSHLRTKSRLAAAKRLQTQRAPTSTAHQAPIRTAKGIPEVSTRMGTLTTRGRKCHLMLTTGADTSSCCLWTECRNEMMLSDPPAPGFCRRARLGYHGRQLDCQTPVPHLSTAETLCVCVWGGCVSRQTSYSTVSRSS